MDINTLRDYAKKYHVTVGTIEQDYVITNLLSLIHEYPKLNTMIFKGGTCIKKAHYEDFRFSVDLDFSCTEDISIDFQNFLRNNIDKIDIEYTKIKHHDVGDVGAGFRIMYNQIEGHPNNVKVDLSMRKNIMMECPVMPIKHFYDSFQNMSFSVMALEEIMAEKVSALLYSGHARHIHDVQFLHQRGIKINPDMVRAKTKFEEDEEYDVRRLKKEIFKKETRWRDALKQLMPEIPPFTEVANDVIEFVTKSMK